MQKSERCQRSWKLNPGAAELFRAVGALAFLGLCIVAHFLYSASLSLFLYRLVGGIRKNGEWTEMGGAPFAWTIPLQLPGTALLRFTQHAHGNHVQDGFTFVGALLLFLAPPILFAYCTLAVLMDLLQLRRLCWGRWYWRAAVIVLALVWIPVPEEWAAVYQYTVVY